MLESKLSLHFITDLAFNDKLTLKKPFHDTDDYSCIMYPECEVMQTRYYIQIFCVELSCRQHFLYL
jgi:hypothetical protein